MNLECSLSTTPIFPNKSSRDFHLRTILDSLDLLRSIYLSWNSLPTVERSPLPLLAKLELRHLWLLRSYHPDHYLSHHHYRASVLSRFLGQDPSHDHSQHLGQLLSP